jgi:hypothetical protein
MVTSNNINAKRLKPTIIYIKDMHVGIVKDEIWTLNMQSLLNINYYIFTETVKDIISEFDIRSINSTINKSDSIESHGNNISNLIVLQSENVKDQKNCKSYSTANIPQANMYNQSASPKKESIMKSIANYAIFGKTAKNANSGLLAALSPKKKNPILTNAHHRDSCFKLDSENDSTAMKTKNNSKLTPTINADFLEYELVTLEKDEILEDDSFCDAFYLVGLGKTSKIMNDSEDLKSPCDHKSCSILPALEPQLLHVYQGNSSLNITSPVNYS